MDKDRILLGNDGIVRAYEIMKSAGGKIPENFRKVDYRWACFMQKAALDRYIQLKLERGADMKRRAGELLEKAVSSKGSKDVTRYVKEALAVFEEPIETPEMEALKSEVKELGEETNRITGFRVGGYFRLHLDIAEVGWCADVLREALESGKSKRIRNAAMEILHYDDPGDGGFYSNLGWPSEDPEQLISGRTLWGFSPSEGPARLSHWNYAYTWGPKESIEFAYEELDSKSEYVVRVSVGLLRRRRGIPEGMEFKEGLEADGIALSDGFVIPIGSVKLYEFDIPKEATKDGKVRISLTKVAPAGRNILSEIWLMKKEEMVWKVLD